MNRGTLFIAALLTLASCASAPAADPGASGTDEGAATTGGEDGAAEESDNILPPPTEGRSSTVILDDPYRYALRVELSRVRGTPLEREVRHLLEAIPQWRTVLDTTDLDPIGEIDSIIAASPGKGSKAYMMLARHSASPDRVRAFVVAIAESRGETLEWGMHDGVPVADWPGEADIAQSVAMVRPNWLAVGPSAEVARFIAMTRAGSTEIVPGFPMPWEGDGPVVEEEFGLMGESRGGAEGAVTRPHFPTEFSFRISNDAEGNVTARWVALFEDAAGVAAASEHWDAQRREYAGNPMLSLLGLSSALEGARFESNENQLTFSLHLTLIQMSRLIRFMTPMIVGGRRGNRGARGSEETPTPESGATAH